jgi:hypothetical protein
MRAILTDKTMIRQIRQVFPEYDGSDLYVQVAETAFIATSRYGGSYFRYGGVNMETGEAIPEEAIACGSHRHQLDPATCIFRWEHLNGWDMGIVACVHPESAIGRKVIAEEAYWSKKMETWLANRN